jgi:magnesium chelatase family protein
MTPAEVRACAVDPAASALLADLYARRRLSGRAHDRALRLARTVADLAGVERIGEGEMAQALQLRRRDRV